MKKVPLDPYLHLYLLLFRYGWRTDDDCTSNAKPTSDVTRENANADRTTKSHRDSFSFKWLKKSHMPIFDGSSDPEKAEKWINKMERSFEVLKTPKEVKVMVAKS